MRIGLYIRLIGRPGTQPPAPTWQSVRAQALAAEAAGFDIVVLEDALLYPDEAGNLGVWETVSMAGSEVVIGPSLRLPPSAEVDQTGSFRRAIGTVAHAPTVLALVDVCSRLDMQVAARIPPARSQTRNDPERSLSTCPIESALSSTPSGFSASDLSGSSGSCAPRRGDARAEDHTCEGRSACPHRKQIDDLWRGERCRSALVTELAVGVH